MRKQETKISEAQIQKALRRFRLAGGKIEHIPDQVTPRIYMARSRADSLSGSVQMAASAIAEVARPMPE
jgi:hypothetical protein